MERVYSTGAVENATSNPSTSTWVKVVNLSETQELSVDVKVYKLNGQKSEIATSSFTVFPLSSDFDIFDVIDILQYEVQVWVSDGQNAIVTVWGKDANAELIAAQRFVQNELSIISGAAKAVSELSTPRRRSRPTPRRRRR